MTKKLEEDNINKFMTDEIIAINEIHKKAKEIFDFMENALFEREELTRLLLLAIFAKENLFMYGPPGTAKTNIADTLHLLTEGSFFTKLMTDFTHYDDIFGKELKHPNGMTERVLKGKLPTADYAFLDEIFKASPEILNSLLTVLNERLFDDDYNGRIKVPLRMALAASNEFPRTSYLKALFERFPLRIPVPNIKIKSNRKRLFEGDFEKIKNLPKFTHEQIDFIQEGFKKKSIKFGDEETNLLNDLIDTLHQLLNPEKSEKKKDAIESLYEISGRTMYKMGSIMRLSAYINKRTKVDISDLLLTRYILWNDIFQRESVLPKINTVIFGGEYEYHGDTSRNLEELSAYILRYIRNIKIKFKGIEPIKLEKDFIYFQNEVGSFLKEFREIINGLKATYNILLKCKEKEEIVKKNIFLHFDKILDWKVDDSLIKVESQKFNELTLNITDYKELKVGDKYYFKKLLEMTFIIHETICQEIEDWIEKNETFFDYKENIGAL
ncbi:AAA family ATPase [Aliarcobacter butzleri]|uniref:AAA family ATPase n=1 Tax=Aliarcobacter butzleri TaxID=28197 RepID=UPI0021B2629C|nr:AAA family ATPase [Aliarcobacter butzleri]MCT7563184.1 AAA family ATPase [Aliarcobacter butzleri]MCT7578659.1 AAA family ATPase [Aliarcobacter butzleri]MCT7647601.1 AAA family ATPase [Aliarcobacter butzleri]